MRKSIELMLNVIFITLFKIFMLINSCCTVYQYRKVVKCSLYTRINNYDQYSVQFMLLVFFVTFYILKDEKEKNFFFF